MPPTSSAYVFARAELMSASADAGSRRHSRSPNDTMPTTCPPSTTGSGGSR